MIYISYIVYFMNFYIKKIFADFLKKTSFVKLKAGAKILPHYTINSFVASIQAFRISRLVSIAWR